MLTHYGSSATECTLDRRESGLRKREKLGHASLHRGKELAPLNITHPGQLWPNYHTAYRVR